MQSIAFHNVDQQRFKSWNDGETAETGQEPELASVIGGNLRRYRKQRGLSLEQFGKLSKVSRAMLGQIELNRSVPTITVLLKIARALDLPVSALLSSDPVATPRLFTSGTARVLSSPSGQFRSRALFPTEASRKVEFYELNLDALASEVAEPCQQGTKANLALSEGVLEVALERQVYSLAEGDALSFMADIPHSYRNPGKAPTKAYLVLAYAESRY